MVLNTSRFRSELGLASLGNQESIYVHFYAAKPGDLAYRFSKEVPNGEEQRGEARKILGMTHDAYARTPDERWSTQGALRLAERRFKPVLRQDG